jgi:hypothetical protein
MDRSELIEYLVDEEAVEEEKAVEMSNLELFQEALQWNGIIGYDRDIRDWAEPYFQEHFSESPEELNISACWIQKKYHELVDKGIIKENESEPAVEYPNNIFLP